ncbi:MAG: hypothetical protein ACI8PD_000097 [Nitrospinales bacterium]|jgi:hypothetical protein
MPFPCNMTHLVGSIFSAIGRPFISGANRQKDTTLVPHITFSSKKGGQNSLYYLLIEFARRIKFNRMGPVIHNGSPFGAYPVGLVIFIFLSFSTRVVRLSPSKFAALFLTQPVFSSASSNNSFSKPSTVFLRLIPSSGIPT